MHDDQRGADLLREVNGAVDLLNRISAEHPAGDQEERRMDRLDPQAVVRREAGQEVAVLRRRLLGDHHLDGREAGIRDLREGLSERALKEGGRGEEELHGNVF
jgi:hypothetical protein